MWEQTRKLISTLLYPCLSELNIMVYNRTPELVQLPHSYMDRNITPDMVRYLSNHGDKIYANNTRLIEEFNMLNKFNRIARKIQQHYHFNTDEYHTFYELCDKLNHTSFAQVTGHYLSDFFEANKRNEYIPRGGYPGTLAPGILFPDQFPIESLPLVNPLPWPDFQMLPWYVKAPVGHPYTIGTEEFMAINNLLDPVNITSYHTILLSYHIISHLITLCILFYRKLWKKH